MNKRIDKKKLKQRNKSKSYRFLQKIYRKKKEPKEISQAKKRIGKNQTKRQPQKKIKKPIKTQLKKTKI